MATAFQCEPFPSKADSSPPSFQVADCTGGCTANEISTSDPASTESGAGGPEKFWVGLSHILPGGRAGPDAGGLEKVYVILEGELTLRSDGAEAVLGRLDSCAIGPGVVREIFNAGKEVVTMLVIMPRVAG